LFNIISTSLHPIIITATTLITIIVDVVDVVVVVVGPISNSRLFNLGTPSTDRR
jgi:hypothetical protein